MFYQIINAHTEKSVVATVLGNFYKKKHAGLYFACEAPVGYLVIVRTIHGKEIKQAGDYSN